MVKEVSVDYPAILWVQKYCLKFWAAGLSCGMLLEVIYAWVVIGLERA